MRAVQSFILHSKFQVMIFISNFRSDKSIACRVSNTAIHWHHSIRPVSIGIAPHHRILYRGTTGGINSPVFSGLVAYNCIVHQIHRDTRTTRSNGTSLSLLIVQYTDCLIIGPQRIHGIQSRLTGFRRSHINRSSSYIFGARPTGTAFNLRIIHGSVSDKCRTGNIYLSVKGKHRTAMYRFIVQQTTTTERVVHSYGINTATASQLVSETQLMVSLSIHHGQSVQRNATQRSIALIAVHHMINMLCILG